MGKRGPEAGKDEKQPGLHCRESSVWTRKESIAEYRRRKDYTEGRGLGYEMGCKEVFQASSRLPTCRGDNDVRRYRDQKVSVRPGGWLVEEPGQLALLLCYPRRARYALLPDK